MKILELRIVDGYWCVDYVDDLKVKRLFGTTLIPTPFKSNMPVGMMIETIADKNPGHSIVAFDRGRKIVLDNQ